MRPIEDTISRWERWIDRIQIERDGHAVLVADPRSSAIQRAFSEQRLVKLEAEVAEAQRELDVLYRQRLHPAMLLRHRPTPMLKITTPRRERERRRA